jgi:hypothetical protein
MARIPVLMDLLMANQAIAALESRAEYLANIPGKDPDVAHAWASTVAANLAIRAAFRLTEAQLDAAHEATMADLADLAEAEAPLADWSPGEIVEAYGR